MADENSPLASIGGPNARQTFLRLEAEKLQRSFMDFARAAWPVVEPGKKFRDNWHLHAIAEHLEAVTRRDIKRLIINIPPRMAKSTMVSVLWPAWTWTFNPQHQFLCVSYAEKLAVRDNLKHRRLGASPWYRDRWGPVWEFTGDQNQKLKFENNRSGYRIAAGITGGIMGDGGDCVCQGTKILTEVGEVEISKLVAMDKIPRVLSFDHSTQRYEFRRVVATRTIPNRSVVSVTTNRGHQLTCTPDHRLHARDTYRPAIDLGVGSGISVVDPWLMSKLRGKRVEKIDPLLGVLSEGAVGHRRPRLRTMWGSLRTSVACLQKGNARGSNPVLLLEGMSKSIQCECGISETEALHRVREAAWQRQQSILLKGVLRFRSAIDSIRYQLQFLRGSVSGAFKSSPILLQGMCIASSFAPHAWKEQFALQGRYQLRQMVRFDASFDQGTRRSSLCRLQSAGEKANPEVARQSGRSFESDHSPLGRNASEQCAGESDYAVHEVSHKIASLQSDAVRGIERVRSEPVTVYDIQVERSHNFFANGILVHNCVVIDDPLDREAANSDKERTRANDVFDGSIITRLNDPAESAIVLIMQRLHEDDLTGHLLEQSDEEWEILCLPMEYEQSRAIAFGATSIGWEDPRTEEGELLHPSRYPRKTVERLKTKLGPYGTSGQFQQNPVPTGGGIIKRADWQIWPPEDYPTPANGERIPFPDMEYIVGSLDTAATEDEENDFSALTIWGIWRDHDRIRDRFPTRVSPRFPNQSVADLIRMPESEKSKIMLLHGWQKRLLLHGPPEYKPPGVTDAEWNSPEFKSVRQEKWGLVEWVVDTCRRYKIHKLLIEAKSAGHQVAQELALLYQNEPWGVELVTPTGDKVARCLSVQPLFSAGIVWAPMVYVPKLELWRHPIWCEGIISQFSRFPKGAHDDLVDSGVHALRHLRDIRMAMRDSEVEAEWEQELRGPGKGRRRALYDV
jgi:predicted phage terminase large subunit-like protein